MVVRVKGGELTNEAKAIIEASNGAYLKAFGSEVAETLVSQPANFVELAARICGVVETDQLRLMRMSMVHEKQKKFDEMICNYDAILTEICDSISNSESRKFYKAQIGICLLKAFIYAEAMDRDAFNEEMKCIDEMIDGYAFPDLKDLVKKLKPTF